MDPQLKKGLLDACVLKVLDYGDSYGYKIVKDLSPILEISESTLYPVLKRLESAGEVKVYTVEHNSRLRKYYQINPEGKKRIKEFVEDWKEVNQVFEFIRGGVKDE